METESKDVSQIQDEDVLRRMWQQTEDFGRKKEIRSHMYKLREARLKEFYTTGEVLRDVQRSNSSPGLREQHTKTSHWKTEPTHADSLMDHSFLSLKSKEIRDSESPTRDVSYHISSGNRCDNGNWTIITSEKSDDGKYVTTSKVNKSQGSHSVDGGTVNFSTVNETKSTIYSDGDDKNFSKSIENSQQHVAHESTNLDSNNTVIKSKTSSSSHYSSYDSADNLKIDANKSKTSDDMFYDMPAEFNAENCFVTKDTQVFPDGSSVTTIRYESKDGSQVYTVTEEKSGTSTNKSMYLETDRFEKGSMFPSDQDDQITKHELLVSNNRRNIDFANDDINKISSEFTNEYVTRHYDNIYDNRRSFDADHRDENRKTITKTTEDKYEIPRDAKKVKRDESLLTSSTKNDRNDENLPVSEIKIVPQEVEIYESSFSDKDSYVYKKTISTVGDNSSHYHEEYANKKISLDVSPTHDAFARSLRSVTPESDDERFKINTPPSRLSTHSQSKVKSSTEKCRKHLFKEDKHISDTTKSDVSTGRSETYEKITSSKNIRESPERKGTKKSPESIPKKIPANPPEQNLTKKSETVIVTKTDTEVSDKNINKHTNIIDTGSIDKEKHPSPNKRITTKTDYHDGFIESEKTELFKQQQSPEKVPKTQSTISCKITYETHPENVPSANINQPKTRTPSPTKTDHHPEKHTPEQTNETQVNVSKENYQTSLTSTTISRQVYEDAVRNSAPKKPSSRETSPTKDYTKTTKQPNKDDSDSIPVHPKKVDETKIPSDHIRKTTQIDKTKPVSRETSPTKKTDKDSSPVKELTSPDENVKIRERTTETTRSVIHSTDKSAPEKKIKSRETSPAKETRKVVSPSKHDISNKFITQEKTHEITYYKKPITDEKRFEDHVRKPMDSDEKIIKTPSETKPNKDIITDDDSNKDIIIQFEFETINSETQVKVPLETPAEITGRSEFKQQINEIKLDDVVKEPIIQKPVSKDTPSSKVAPIPNKSTQMTLKLNENEERDEKTITNTISITHRKNLRTEEERVKSPSKESAPIKRIKPSSRETSPSKNIIREKNPSRETSPSKKTVQEKIPSTTPSSPKKITSRESSPSKKVNEEKIPSKEPSPIRKVTRERIVSRETSPSKKTQEKTVPKDSCPKQITPETTRKSPSPSKNIIRKETSSRETSPSKKTSPETTKEVAVPNKPTQPRTNLRETSPSKTVPEKITSKDVRQTTQDTTVTKDSYPLKKPDSRESPQITHETTEVRETTVFKTIIPVKIDSKDSPPKKIIEEKISPTDASPKQVPPEKSVPRDTSPAKIAPEKNVPREYSPSKIPTQKTSSREGSPSKNIIQEKIIPDDSCPKQIMQEKNVPRGSSPTKTNIPDKVPSRESSPLKKTPQGPASREASPSKSAKDIKPKTNIQEDVILKDSSPTKKGIQDKNTPTSPPKKIAPEKTTSREPSPSKKNSMQINGDTISARKELFENNERVEIRENELNTYITNKSLGSNKAPERNTPQDIYIRYEDVYIPGDKRDQHSSRDSSPTSDASDIEFISTKQHIVTDLDIDIENQIMSKEKIETDVHESSKISPKTTPGDKNEKKPKKSSLKPVQPESKEPRKEPSTETPKSEKKEKEKPVFRRSETYKERCRKILGMPEPTSQEEPIMTVLDYANLYAGKEPVEEPLIIKKRISLLGPDEPEKEVKKASKNFLESEIIQVESEDIKLTENKSDSKTHPKKEVDTKKPADDKHIVVTVNKTQQIPIKSETTKTNAFKKTEVDKQMTEVKKIEQDKEDSKYIRKVSPSRKIPIPVSKLPEKSLDFISSEKREIEDQRVSKKDNIDKNLDREITDKTIEPKKFINQNKIEILPSSEQPDNEFIDEVSIKEIHKTDTITHKTDNITVNLNKQPNEKITEEGKEKIPNIIQICPARRSPEKLPDESEKIIAEDQRKPFEIILEQSKTEKTVKSSRQTNINEFEPEDTPKLLPDKKTDNKTPVLKTPVCSGPAKKPEDIRKVTNVEKNKHITSDIREKTESIERNTKTSNSVEKLIKMQPKQSGKTVTRTVHKTTLITDVNSKPKSYIRTISPAQKSPKKDVRPVLETKQPNKTSERIRKGFEKDVEIKENMIDENGVITINIQITDDSKPQKMPADHLETRTKNKTRSVETTVKQKQRTFEPAKKTIHKTTLVANIQEVPKNTYAQKDVKKSTDLKVNKNITVDRASPVETLRKPRTSKPSSPSNKDEKQVKRTVHTTTLVANVSAPKTTDRYCVHSKTTRKQPVTETKYVISKPKSDTSKKIIDETFKVNQTYKTPKENLNKITESTRKTVHKTTLVADIISPKSVGEPRTYREPTGESPNTKDVFSNTVETENVNNITIEISDESDIEIVPEEFKDETEFLTQPTDLNPEIIYSNIETRVVENIKERISPTRCTKFDKDILEVAVTKPKTNENKPANITRTLKEKETKEISVTVEPVTQSLPRVKKTDITKDKKQLNRNVSEKKTATKVIHLKQYDEPKTNERLKHVPKTVDNTLKPKKPVAKVPDQRSATPQNIKTTKRVEKVIQIGVPKKTPSRETLSKPSTPTHTVSTVRNTNRSSKSPCTIAILNEDKKLIPKLPTKTYRKSKENLVDREPIKKHIVVKTLSLTKTEEKPKEDIKKRTSVTEKPKTRAKSPTKDTIKTTTDDSLKIDTLEKNTETIHKVTKTTNITTYEQDKPQIPTQSDDVDGEKENEHPDSRIPKICITLKSLEVDGDAPNEDNVIIDLLRSKSSRDSSPEKIWPIPVSSEEETEYTRYPDQISEPDETPRRQFRKLQDISLEENEVISDFNKITEITNEEQVLDESCLSVNEKVTRFMNTAEKITKKPKMPAQKLPRPDFVVTDDLKQDECLLSVSEKVSRFMTTSERLTSDTKQKSAFNYAPKSKITDKLTDITKTNRTSNYATEHNIESDDHLISDECIVHNLDDETSFITKESLVNVRELSPPKQRDRTKADQSPKEMSPQRENLNQINREPEKDSPVTPAKDDKERKPFGSQKSPEQIPNPTINVNKKAQKYLTSIETPENSQLDKKNITLKSSEAVRRAKMLFENVAQNQTTKYENDILNRPSVWEGRKMGEKKAKEPETVTGDKSKVSLTDLEVNNIKETPKFTKPEPKETHLPLTDNKDLSLKSTRLILNERQDKTPTKPEETPEICKINFRSKSRSPEKDISSCFIRSEIKTERNVSEYTQPLDPHDERKPSTRYDRTRPSAERDSPKTITKDSKDEPKSITKINKKEPPVIVKTVTRQKSPSPERIKYERTSADVTPKATLNGNEKPVPGYTKLIQTHKHESVKSDETRAKSPEEITRFKPKQHSPERTTPGYMKPLEKHTHECEQTKITDNEKIITQENVHKTKQDINEKALPKNVHTPKKYKPEDTLVPSSEKINLNINIISKPKQDSNDKTVPSYMRPLHKHEHKVEETIDAVDHQTHTTLTSISKTKHDAYEKVNIEKIKQLNANDDEIPGYMKPLQRHSHDHGDMRIEENVHSGTTKIRHGTPEKEIFERIKQTSPCDQQMPGYMKPLQRHSHDHGDGRIEENHLLAETIAVTKTKQEPTEKTSEKIKQMHPTDQETPGYMRPLQRHSHDYGDMRHEEHHEVHSETVKVSKIRQGTPERTITKTKQIDSTEKTVPNYMKPLEKHKPERVSTKITESDKTIEEPTLKQQDSTEKSLPGYMKPLQRQTSEPRDTKAEEDNSDAPRAGKKFGVTLRRTDSGRTVIVNSTTSTLSERRRSSTTSNSGQPVIEEIQDLELLEDMMEKAVGYEQRRRIRSQIRNVRRIVNENKPSHTHDKKVPNKPSSSTKESHVVKKVTSKQTKSPEDLLPTDNTQTSKKTVITKYEEKHETDTPKLEISTKTDESEVSYAEGIETGRKVTTRTERTQQATRIVSTETKNLTFPRSSLAKKEESPFTSETQYEDSRSTDVITSSYGIGPTDENGLPLFGIRALRKAGREAQVHVTGTVISSQFYSENGNEPVGQVSVTKYSTDPQDLGLDYENTDKSKDCVAVTTTQKFGSTGSPSLKEITQKKSSEEFRSKQEESKKSVSAKVTRRGSVKALSQKFIDNAVESTKNERSSFPKAGLILRTGNFKDDTVHDSANITEQEHSQEFHRKSSCTNEEMYTSSQTVETRHLIPESPEGPSSASLVLQVQKATGKESGKPGNIITRNFESSTVHHKSKDILDEQTLRLLLEQCVDYEERKVIREKLKQVMAEQEVCANEVSRTMSTEQEIEDDKTSVQERVETTERTIIDEPNKTIKVSTTQVTTSVKSKPMSPFAKFRQLDKQNSLNTPPSSPRTPGGGGSRAPIFKFTDPALSQSASTVKERLLQWCQMKTKEYQNIKLDNFSTSWADGLAFCALIHHFLPDAFDYHALTPQHRRHNFTLAFKVADEQAGIFPLLDVDDMVAMRRPDWKCVFTYVQAIYRRFKDED